MSVNAPEEVVKLDAPPALIRAPPVPPVSCNISLDSTFNSLALELIIAIFVVAFPSNVKVSAVISIVPFVVFSIFSPFPNVISLPVTVKSPFKTMLLKRASPTVPEYTLLLFEASGINVNSLFDLSLPKKPCFSVPSKYLKAIPLSSVSLLLSDPIKRILSEKVTLLAVKVPLTSNVPPINVLPVSSSIRKVSPLGPVPPVP